MSMVTYNDVQLPYPFHTNFKQEAVYEDSGTDRIYTKFDIEIMTLINCNFLNLLAPDLVNSADGSKLTTNPADIMGLVRTRLLQQRKKLSVQFNGVELIPKAQEGLVGTVDAKNGPQPQYCEIKELNNTTFIVAFRVIANYWENNATNSDGSAAIPANNQQGNNVLYNRWSETVDMDENMMTLRTRDGKFVIRSDNYEGKTADQIRSQMAVVSVPAGFNRKSASYTVSPDGLGIQYRIVDREVFKQPPGPALTAQGAYTETTTNMGAMRMAEVRLRLTGSKATNQSELIEKAVKVCAAKLAIQGADITPSVRGGGAWLAASSITVDMYQNAVECSFRAVVPPLTNLPGTGRVQGTWGMDFNAMAITPYSRPQDSPPNYFDRGTASILLQAAAYYDPSLKSTVLNRKTGELSTGFLPGEVGLFLE